MDARYPEIPGGRIWDGITIASPQTLVMLKPQHRDLSGQGSSRIFISARVFIVLPVLLMLPWAMGGCWGWNHHPKMSPSTITSRTQLLGTEKILGSEALQPLLIFCLEATAKIDIWDALLLLELH